MKMIKYGDVLNGFSVRGYPSVTKGLAVTRVYNGNGRLYLKHWRVTHTASLLFVVDDIPTRAQAHAIAALLSHTTDWTQSADRLSNKRDRPGKRAAVARARSFILPTSTEYAQVIENLDGKTE